MAELHIAESRRLRLPFYVETPADVEIRMLAKEKEELMFAVDAGHLLHADNRPNNHADDLALLQQMTQLLREKIRSRMEREMLEGEEVRHTNCRAHIDLRILRNYVFSYMQTVADIEQVLREDEALHDDRSRASYRAELEKVGAKLNAHFDAHPILRGVVEAEVFVSE